MAFGISFGSQKQTGTTSDTVNKTETQNQTQTGTQSSTGTTTTTGAQNTQTSSNTNQSQSGTSAQNTNTQQQSQSTQFSEPVLGALENTVQALLGNIPNQPSTLKDDFNADQFVSGGVQAAQASVNSDLENTLNGIFDSVGGRDDQNSMATLLANRARGDAAANIAGVRSNLTGQAQQIEANRYLANLQGVGQQEGFVSQVLAALKGGRAATTATGQEATTGATTQEGQSATQGAENTQTSQTQIQNIVQQILQQLQGTTNTVGSETGQTTGKTSGFGFGLSI